MRLIDFLNRRPWLVAAAVVVAATLYVASGLFDGWIPHDEGQLAQTAERTLAGELPHRDFDEMYSGGLSFLNAAAFRWWGVDCASLRVPLALCFVPTIAAYFYLASRVLTPVAAALSTALAATLSIPTYSAAMPSWYNLLLAIGGAGSLVRYVETERGRWLFAAGLCGGLSVVVKITGLYFVAAGLLFLAYREQLLSEEAVENELDEGRRAGWYSWMLSLGLTAFAALGLGFVRSGRPEMNLIHFTAPMAGMAFYLLVRERRLRFGPSLVRFQRILGMLAPFALGAALPVAALVGYYAGQGALGDLYEGVFELPRLRVGSGAFPLPPFSVFVLAVPLAGLIACGWMKASPLREAVEKGEIVGLGILLLAAGTEGGFTLAWGALRNSLPWLIGLGVAVLIYSRRTELNAQRRQMLFIVAATAALVGLVQYPHAYGIYFYYVAPLAVLLAGYVIALAPFPAWHTAMAAGVFYLAFAAWQLNGPDPHRNAGGNSAPRQMEPMGLERCDLTAPKSDAVAYRELVDEVERHSAAGSYILAGPDCPEVYFLSGRRNPSRVMYDFFRPQWLADRDELFRLLDARGVNVVVVNPWPSFSAKMPAELEAAIAERYPQRRAIMIPGKTVEEPIERFRVYWRE